ncbi:DUF378 domain-containing protein [Xanthomonas oryzae pv. oryzae]|nr:DUF378 domain-containing protein [Xanthomonas oryzae pv. oryzae]
MPRLWGRPTVDRNAVRTLALYAKAVRRWALPGLAVESGIAAPVCHASIIGQSRRWRPLSGRADTAHMAGGCERHVCKAHREWATLPGYSPGHAESGVCQPTWNAFMKAINVITLVLLIVGGLNWGWSACFRWPRCSAGRTRCSRVVYTLVGIWALWQLVTLLRNNHGVAEHHTSPHVRNNP